MTDVHDEFDEPDEPTGEGGSPAVDGIEHLRRAAREMIGATRALLDVIEDVVERPGAMDEIVGMVGAIGEQLRRGAGMGGGSADRDPFLRDEPDDGVQRIQVD